VWRQRCFELLASGELVYSHQGRELGRVALKGAFVTTPSSCCDSRREFVVRSAGQVLTLRATDADERDTWVRKLNAYSHLAACLIEGHPMRLREAMKDFEAAGFAAEAQEARAKLPQVASAYLTARLAEGDMTRLHEAIFEAEAEGLSDQAAEARAQLPQLVYIAPFTNFAFVLSMSYLTTISIRVYSDPPPPPPSPLPL